jgi:hypothetical protein
MESPKKREANVTNFVSPMRETYRMVKKGQDYNTIDEATKEEIIVNAQNQASNLTTHHLKNNLKQNNLGEGGEFSKFQNDTDSPMPHLGQMTSQV